MSIQPFAGLVGLFSIVQGNVCEWAGGGGGGATLRDR